MKELKLIVGQCYKNEVGQKIEIFKKTHNGGFAGTNNLDLVHFYSKEGKEIVDNGTKPYDIISKWENNND